MTVQEKLLKIKQGKLSTEKNIQQFLKIIEQKNKKINAFLFVNKNAVKEAKVVDKKITQGKDGPGRAARNN